MNTAPAVGSWSAGRQRRRWVGPRSAPCAVCGVVFSWGGAGSRPRTTCSPRCRRAFQLIGWAVSLPWRSCLRCRATTARPGVRPHCSAPAYVPRPTKGTFSCSDCGATFNGDVRGRHGVAVRCPSCALTSGLAGLNTPEARAHHDKLRKERLQGGESIDPLRDVFERDGWVCGICGEPIDAALKVPDHMAPTVDHRVPLARGGRHERANVGYGGFWNRTTRYRRAS